MTPPTPSAHSGEQGKPSDAALAPHWKNLDSVAGLLERAGQRNAAGMVDDAVKAIRRELERSEALERKHEQGEPVFRTLDAKPFTHDDAQGLDAPPPSEQAGISDEVVERAMRAYWEAVRDSGFKTDRPRAGVIAALQSAFPRGVGSGATLPALDVFRIAGGDTECSPNPSAQQAMECLQNLRECYDEVFVYHAPKAQADAALADTQRAIIEAAEARGYERAKSELAHPAPEAQAEGEKPVAEIVPACLGVGIKWHVKLTDLTAGSKLYLRPQPSASETPSADARDAERYRWLRANAYRAAGPVTCWFDHDDGCLGESVTFEGEHFDNALDEAIAAQRKEGES